MSSFSMHEDEAKRLLQAFIETDTQNPPGQERQLAEKIRTFLEKRAKPDNDRLTLKFVPCREKGRDSLLAHLKGRGECPPIILCGHMDTVPIGDVSAWQYDPLRFTLSDGCAYGRGTSDMKSGLAAIVYAFGEAVRQGKIPAGDIYLAATADEESAGLGAAALAPYLPLTDGTVYIAEPTHNDLGICAKGTLWLKITCHGRTAHGAYPERGINAIAAAYRVQERLKAVCQQYQHELLGKTTCTMTGIHGGVKTNMVADTCTLTLDVRTTPDVSNAKICAALDDILKDMMNETVGLKLSYEVLNNRPAVQISPDASEVKAFADIIQEKTGRAPLNKGIKFFSDASIFVRSAPQVRCVQFGPGCENNAHIVDEYVELSCYFQSILCYNELLEQYFIG